MRTIASLLFLFLFVQAVAQRECATMAYTTAARKADKSLAARMDAVDGFINQQSRNHISGISGSTAGDARNAIIRIPVVVHVIYNTAAQNISDAQIQSGIAALNRDFRKQNADTSNTPLRFKAFAADVQIEFVLAKADPIGRATTGIVRKQSTVPAWNMDDKIKFSAQGGDDAWDTKSYLNIWLGNTRRLLGYGTMPGGDEKVDGLVINTTVFGTINTAAPYNLGRTAVHEAGHWLGLYHTWGDAACGDDKVDDTPTQAGYTSGCPSGIRMSCGNNTTGDMYMNFMDFTNDACMNLFTYGQKERMRALFAGGGPRNALLSSTGLNEPWVEAAALQAEEPIVQPTVLQVYPNPVQQEVRLQITATNAKVEGTLFLMNAFGMPVQKIVITAHQQKLQLNLRSGLYFLQGTINNTKISQKLVKL
jgi:hypothetical protein